MAALPSWLSADRLNSAVQWLILVAVQVFLLVVIVLAVVVLGMLAYKAIGGGVILTIESAPEFQMRVQNAFGGALLVLLGLELLETVRTCFAEHRIRLEVIMIVAMIAVSPAHHHDRFRARGWPLAGRRFLPGYSNRISTVIAS